jgi:dTDP-4-amino-4,6-dideoxygalactose transaminase
MKADADHDFLPYSRPLVLEEDIAAVVEALRNTTISQGSRLKELEHEFAARVRSEWAVGLSSGTAAVHAMCFAAGFGIGDEVIVPALTFAGTVNAIRYTGAKPVFADIDADTLCLDPGDVERLVSERTRGIVTVDFAGHPSSYVELRALAQESDLLLLSDAAHAPGAVYRGRPVGGSVADMTAFSLNPVKNITGGEGGVVTGIAEALGDVVRRFGTHGMTRDERLLENDALAAHGWYYEQQMLGYNYKLSELHAALALSQLGRLQQNNDHRARLAGRYTEALGELPLKLPASHGDIRHAWHLYVVRLASPDFDLRNRLFAHLRSRGIGVQLHYIPVPLHPDYRRAGFTMDGLTNTMTYFESALSLPLHQALTDADFERIVDGIKAFF